MKRTATKIAVLFRYRKNFFHEHKNLKGGIFLYTVEEIRQKIIPIAKAYHLKAVWLFGSYARGEATESSDIDLLFDRKNSDITSLVKASSMYQDIKEVFDVPVDLVSANALRITDSSRMTNFNFMKNIERDKIILYERI